MVEPPGGRRPSAVPTTTGMDRSTTPPPTAGSPLTGRGDGVEEIGVSDGTDEVDTDWSNADTLDRQG